MNQLSGIYFINIIGIDLLKKSCKNIEALRNVEIPFSRTGKGQEGQSTHGGRCKCDPTFSHRVYSVGVVQTYEPVSCGSFRTESSLSLCKYTQSAIFQTKGSLPC